ncbi:hypothetical protein Rsub_01487 [Raphidocelis subcapitata]|uniref:EamA domain-containing protein n=1 Tax=Raphidocelis subcapitata TaxID=307507 RepID=A0A2V0NN56_9CHLO|nr:hypothetical protein Rsub_01487 [Raphidocelis subcapitata]|eukprot:GBF88988.1 hypothetical protein Rsub_01487 [Raphidocelis subcapitata]
MFALRPPGGGSEDAAPLLEPGSAESSSGAGPLPAAPAPRGKTRLANVSGFNQPPPKAEFSTHAAIASLWQAFWNSGLSCAAVAYVIFSISAFCVKLTHGHVPVLELCLVRSTLSFTLSVLLMWRLRMYPMFGHRKNAPLLVARGVCGAVSMGAYYVSLQLLPLGDAVTIGLIQPPLTAVASRVLLGEPLGARGALGCVVGLAGVALIMQPPFLFHTTSAAASGGAASARMFGAAMGIAAAVLSSGSCLAIRKLGNAEQAPVIAMAFHTATMALSVLPLALGWPQRAMLPTGRDAGLLVAVAVTSFSAQLLLTRGLQRSAAARVSAVSFSQVIYAYLLSAVVFHDSIGIVSVAGVALTLVGVALVVLRHGPRAAAGPSAAAQLKQQKTMGGAQQQDGGGAPSGLAEPQPLAQAPSLSRALAQQPSFRKLASVGRASMGRVAEGGSTLLRQLSSAASAQLDSAPSMRAADFAVAAEGVCGPCIAVMAASMAAYDAFGGSGGAPAEGGGPEGGAAAAALAAAGAAEAVAAALGEASGPPPGEGERLIPAGTVPSDSVAAAGGEAAGQLGSHTMQQPPAPQRPAPRMSSHLSGDLL